MIPRETARVEAPPAGSWRKILAGGVGDPAELLALLGLETGVSDAACEATRETTRRFPLRVPRSFIARMRKGDPDDPLLRQVLPVGEELDEAPGFRRDPLAELSAAPRPGLLHKYRGRALLVTTGACGVHCRYCFRRHFPYAEQRPEWEEALGYLREDPTLEEIILSGGDPLVLSDERLAPLAEALAEIPHLERLRVHSRMPVVLPERVDEALLGWLTGTRLAPVMVIHANHPNEIDGAVEAALGRLRRAGVTLLNQAVLLRGVNDSAKTLAELSASLFRGGVLPYYLHLLDPVLGAAHFDVGEEEAREICRQLSARLPGYLMPRLVRELPGAPAKAPVDLLNPPIPNLVRGL